MSVKRIKRFGVMQTAKIVSVLYFILAFVFIIPFVLIGSALPTEQFFPGSSFSSIIFLILPFFYAIIGFVTTAIGCALYNLLAKYIGGIEFEVEISNDTN